MPQAQEEVVLALLLRNPHRIEDAVDTLRRLPRFRDRDEDQVRNIASWAHHLYRNRPVTEPASPDESWLDPRPDFLYGALLTAAIAPGHAGLVQALDLPTAARLDPRLLTRMSHAATGFPPLVALVRSLLGADVSQLIALVRVVLVIGPKEGVALRAPLIDALTGRAAAGADIDELLALAQAPVWAPLRPALHRVVVNHLRNAIAVDNTPERRPDLARSLTNLGSSLRGVGEPREALAAGREAVQRYRSLFADNPARYTPDLAGSLTNLGITLRAIGESSEAVLRDGEAVAWWWQLTQLRPGEFDERYDTAQCRFIDRLTKAGHDPNDILRIELAARARLREVPADSMELNRVDPTEERACESPEI